MKNQVKEKYLAPQIEVIQMETEGTSCVIAGSGNLLPPPSRLSVTLTV